MIDYPTIVFSLAIMLAVVSGGFICLWVSLAHMRQDRDFWRDSARRGQRASLDLIRERKQLWRDAQVMDSYIEDQTGISLLKIRKKLVDAGLSPPV